MLVFSLTTVLFGSTPSAETRPDVPWYRRALVGIEVGPTGANIQDPRFMARATGKEIVQNLVRACAEYGVVFMKDMEFAYYDSAAARKCPGLGERDLLRECLDEAKPHGLPIVAYSEIQYDDSSWRQHPEWRMKDSSGKDIPGRLCYNSARISVHNTGGGTAGTTRGERPLRHCRGLAVGVWPQQSEPAGLVHVRRTTTRPGSGGVLLQCV